MAAALFLALLGTTRFPVMGGAPAAAVFFARDVDAVTAADPRVADLQRWAGEASGAQRAALATELASVRTAVRAEMLGRVASHFDRVHDIHRAVDAGRLMWLLSTHGGGGRGSGDRPSLAGPLDHPPALRRARPDGGVSTVGLVLAAGAGRRMGGPKALIRLTQGGPTLVETAVARVLDGGCDRAVVVVGAAGERVAALAHATGAEVVQADDWDEGMGASLRAGLAHLEAGADDLALVTLIDLPDVTAAVMKRVVSSALVEGRAALVRAAYLAVPGHPVAIGRDHWAAVMTTAHGDRGAREHLRATRHRLVECGDLATGRDLDTVQDLHRG